MVPARLRLWRIFIIGRSTVSGIFLGLLFLVNGFVVPAALRPLFLVAATQFAANGIYFYLWKQRDLAFLGYLCFVLEIALITMLIIGFGPHGHVFMLAYLWPIMMGGWLIGNRAILPLTLFSSLAYSLVFVLERLGLVISNPVLTLDGTPQSLVLCLPYLAFLALLIWALTTDIERSNQALVKRNEDLLRLNKRLRALSAAGEHLLGCLDQDTLWDSAVEQAQRISGCTQVTVIRQAEAGLELGDQIEIDSNAPPMTMSTDVPSDINNPSKEPPEPLSIELISPHRMEGQLVFADDDLSFFDEQGLQIMRAFGHQLALAIEDARLVDRLSSERNLLHDILTNMSEAVIGVDSQGRVLLANRTAGNMLDVYQNKLMPDWLVQTLAQPIMDGFSGREHHRLSRNERTIQISSAKTPGKDTPVDEIHVAHDVTHEVEMDRLKSEFLAYASHEMRTPITTIKMMVKLLMMDAPQDSKAQEYLEVIDTQITRQKRLINNLLDLTRLEAGKYELPLRKTSPRQAIESVLGACQPLARDKEIVIHSDTEAAPAGMLSNQVGLEQILQNLLSNAVKFTDPEGEIWLNCASHENQVIFTVKDSGIGMTPSQLEHVFTKFYTVYHPKKRGEGTGLGLALSRLIARDLGGDIAVASQEGIGSCFTLTLPRTAKERG